MIAETIATSIVIITITTIIVVVAITAVAAVVVVVVVVDDVDVVVVVIRQTQNNSNCSTHSDYYAVLAFRAYLNSEKRCCRLSVLRTLLRRAALALCHYLLLRLHSCSCSQR